MKLDRESQLNALRALREKYPGSVNLSEPTAPDIAAADYTYLEELGLIVSFGTDPFRTETGDLVWEDIRLKITAVGLDFLEDDGGISAILRTVTVKIDPDDLRALIAARIEASDLPAEEKSRIAHAIRSLPAQALRDLTTRLVNEAVTRLPGAVQLFQTYVTP